MRRFVYGLLALYIAVSLAYQVAGSVSLIVGYFDLRHQVTEPFVSSQSPPVITSLTPAAAAAGLRNGDYIESVDGQPLHGWAQFQRVRFYARPGDRLNLGVRRGDGSRVVVAIPLEGFPARRVPLAEGAFIVIMHAILPLLMIVIGYRVAIARPHDPRAWLILIVLSYPFSTIGTFNWWPEWLWLRLYWRLFILLASMGALFVLALLFPERSPIDRKAPWLKWLVIVAVAAAIALEFLAEYGQWFDYKFLPFVQSIEPALGSLLRWLLVASVAFYWFALLLQFRTATADARRRLRVLSFGSLVGLGSPLLIWGVLPSLGVDTSGQALGYLSAILLLFFPFSLAYVAIVQRAMDVRILVRMGTRYLLARASLIAIQLGVLGLFFSELLLPLSRRHPDSAMTLILPAAFVGVLIRINFIKRSPMTRVREWLDRRFFREEYDAEKVLGELAARVRHVNNPSGLIDLIGGRISEVLHVTRMAVMVRNGDAFVLDGGALALAESSMPVRHLIGTGSPAVLYREKPAEWFAEAAPGEKLALNELNAEVLIPLPGRERLMGVIVLGPKRSEEPYSPTDLRLLQWVAVQAGLGLEVHELAHSLADEAAKHQRIQREVEIAREVQERLFPQSIPAIAGVELAGHCRPALGVGGDYYDFIGFEDGRLGIAIGDVSGKGIAAALLMASLRASLRGMTADGAGDLAPMMQRLNRLVYEASTANRYATFFFGLYDPASRRLRYVNAGHNPPFVVRAEEALQLEACGPVVGLLKDVAFEEQSVELRGGDVFVGYTDGISEAMTHDDEEWGEERLLAAVPRSESAETILRQVFERADAFTAGAPQHDDMTLVTMKLIA